MGECCTHVHVAKQSIIASYVVRSWLSGLQKDSETPVGLLVRMHVAM